MNYFYFEKHPLGLSFVLFLLIIVVGVGTSTSANNDGNGNGNNYVTTIEKFIKFLPDANITTFTFLISKGLIQ